MRPNSYEISFRLFGFPTVIQPFFWAIALIISALALGQIDDMPLWITQLIVGAIAILLAILVHELGHALTFRHLFREPCVIILHGMGGMAVPEYHRRRPGFYGAVAECFLAFSGPLAGFVLAFAAILLFRAIPANVGGLPVLLLLYFLDWTIWISIVWGILNLMPIYPMDGGRIAREVCAYLFPRRGIEFSLILSMTVAILLIAIALQKEKFFIAFLFGFFAYQNYQEWSFRSFRR